MITAVLENTVTIHFFVYAHRFEKAKMTLKEYIDLFTGEPVKAKR